MENKIIDQTDIEKSVVDTNEHKNNFDIYKDFELRELIEKNDKSKTNKTNDIDLLDSDKEKEYETMIFSLPIINDSIRSNINLSITLFKKINNFDHNYIHSLINEKSNNTTK